MQGQEDFTSLPLIVLNNMAQDGVGRSYYWQLLVSYS